MIGLLANRTLTINDVAENFVMSQPAVSKHMHILLECGLVVMVRHGREKRCRANLGALQEVTQWAEQYLAFWNQRLDILEDLLNNKE
jgi:DNA-binding transcriptional ArsR family regulator